MSRRSTTIGACVLAVGACGLIGAAAAGAPGNSYFVSANLNAASEVPRPNAPAAARGSYHAILDGTALTWRVSFRGLSGRVLQAHIHIGRRGVAGPVAVPLCGPCPSGLVGRARLSSSVVAAIRSGRAYVNLHTARNPSGEVRGQLRAVR